MSIVLSSMEPLQRPFKKFTLCQLECSHLVSRLLVTMMHSDVGTCQIPSVTKQSATRDVTTLIFISGIIHRSSSVGGLPTT